MCSRLRRTGEELPHDPHGQVVPSGELPDCDVPHVHAGPLWQVVVEVREIGRPRKRRVDVRGGVDRLGIVGCQGDGCRNAQSDQGAPPEDFATVKADETARATPDGVQTVLGGDGSASARST